MRKVVVSMFVSVDGYIEGPGKTFLSPPWSQDMDAWTRSLQDQGDCLVFGSTCWSQLAEYWSRAETHPESAAELELARYMNRTPKVVFSRSLATAEAWTNSELVASPVTEFVPELQKRPGKDIVILGGAALATSVMEANLVDEYRLLVVPTLYGGGTRLFAEGRPHVDLKLVEHRPLDTGAVLLRYHRG